MSTPVRYCPTTVAGLPAEYGDGLGWTCRAGEVATPRDAAHLAYLLAWAGGGVFVAVAPEPAPGALGPAVSDRGPASPKLSRTR